jgi:hypothetical protein
MRLQSPGNCTPLLYPTLDASLAHPRSLPHVTLCGRHRLTRPGSDGNAPGPSWAMFHLQGSKTRDSRSGICCFLCSESDQALAQKNRRICSERIAALVDGSLSWRRDFLAHIHPKYSRTLCGPSIKSQRKAFRQMKTTQPKEMESLHLIA